MGRPLGRLQGRTEEANALASWLRGLTRQVPSRQLELDTPYSKTSWSAFRNGSTLVPLTLLEQAVRLYVHEPVAREQQLQRGRLLLHAAQAAAKRGSSEAPQLRARTTRSNAANAVLLRLDDARLGELEAQQKLMASEERCGQLQSMVEMLTNRCAQLEIERDYANTLAEFHKELRQSDEFGRQTEVQLEHARSALRATQDVLRMAEDQVSQGQHVLRQHARDNEGALTRPLVRDRIPVAFWAFHRQYRQAYHHYAVLQLGDEELAGRVVHLVFLSLLKGWSRLMEEGNPAQSAWAHLKKAVDEVLLEEGRESEALPDAVAFVRVSRAVVEDARAEFAALASELGLYSAISRLPGRQLDVVVLHYVLKYDTAATARIMGITHATVRSHRFHARKSLAQELGLEQEVDQDKEGQA